MKAIIEIGRGDAVFAAATEQLAAARVGMTVDFRLQFESARTLFAEVTPERLELLDLLRRTGPRTATALIDALPAPHSRRDSAADLARLETLGLIERGDDDLLSVPFTAVEIILPLAQVA
jgi:predicted transcriptional regulator